MKMAAEKAAETKLMRNTTTNKQLLACLSFLPVSLAVLLTVACRSLAVQLTVSCYHASLACQMKLL